MLSIDHQQRGNAQHEGNIMNYQLSTSTIKKYNARQLANHIERVQDKFDFQLYRIDRAYGKIYRLFNGDYVFRGSYDKENLLEELNLLYQSIEQSDLKACN
jgi:hypothetical protein